MPIQPMMSYTISVLYHKLGDFGKCREMMDSLIVLVA